MKFRSTAIERIRFRSCRGERSGGYCRDRPDGTQGVSAALAGRSWPARESRPMASSGWYKTVVQSGRSGRANLLIFRDAWCLAFPPVGCANLSEVGRRRRATRLPRDQSGLLLNFACYRVSRDGPSRLSVRTTLVSDTGQVNLSDADPSAISRGGQRGYRQPVRR
jgi:hypothetical protein